MYDVRQFKPALYLLLMLAIAEPHDLDESPVGVGGVPVGAAALVCLKMIAPQPRQRLLETLQQACVLGSLIPGDDVAVRLQ